MRFNVRAHLFYIYVRVSVKGNDNPATNYSFR
nr:MAG TPA: hypothetical protein [Microviridae sp.]